MTDSLTYVLHLLDVEDDIQLAHVLEVAVERLHHHLPGAWRSGRRPRPRRGRLPASLGLNLTLTLTLTLPEPYPHPNPHPNELGAPPTALLCHHGAPAWARVPG